MEKPLSIYMGVMVHTKTCKRELVDHLYDMGLSISYDRVLDVSTELGHKKCHYYKRAKAVDNIDHNASSTTPHDSFHDTEISLFQHPDNDFSGVFRALANTHHDSADIKNT